MFLGVNSIIPPKDKSCNGPLPPHSCLGINILHTGRRVASGFNHYIDSNKVMNLSSNLIPSSDSSTT